MTLSSIEEADANSYGVAGTIEQFNEERRKEMEAAMMAIAEEISDVADGFFGHVKAVMTSTNGWIGLNLVDTRLGVDVSGSMSDGVCDFKSMAVALDIEHESLKRIMHSRLELVKGLEVRRSIPNVVSIDGSL